MYKNVADSIVKVIAQRGVGTATTSKSEGFFIMKKDAFYFPHFANARHDRKLKRVQKELGLEGYAIYFQLLEVLREQLDFKYPFNDVDLLADEMGTSEPKIKAVICNYDLFTIDEDSNFFSIKQLYYLQPYIEKTQRARLAAKKRWDNVNDDANAMQMHSKCNADAMQVKESKVKETKVKESKVNLSIYNIDFEEWWFKYDKKTGKEKSLIKWNLLNKEEKDLALSVVEQYVDSTPEKKFRKDPATYLHNKSFNDEIINRNLTSSHKPSYAEREWERLKNL